MIYLSTYNTDLILVPEEKHDEALKLLNHSVSQPRSPRALPASITPGLQVFLTVLPDKLAIANFKSQDIRLSCHSLIQQFFFPSSTNRFFSFTGFPTETSIILERSILSTFPADSLEIHPSTWIALEVHVGTSSGMNVNMLSGLLANADISIYYLSTFHTDFILVSEDKVASAIECLKSNLSIIVEEK